MCCACNRPATRVGLRWSGRPLRRFEFRRYVGRVRRRSRSMPLVRLRALQSLWSGPVSDYRVSDPALALPRSSPSRCSSYRPLRVILSCACAPLRSASYRRPAPHRGRRRRCRRQRASHRVGSGRLPWGFGPIRDSSTGIGSRASQSRDISVLVVRRPRRFVPPDALPVYSTGGRVRGSLFRGFLRTHGRAGFRPPMPSCRSRRAVVAHATIGCIRDRAAVWRSPPGL